MAKSKAAHLGDIDFYPPFGGFPAEGIDFMKRLKRNNNRPWFEKHKEEYESYVKLPMQSLIVALQPYFLKFAPEFDLNPKKSLKNFPKRGPLGDGSTSTGSVQVF